MRAEMKDLKIRTVSPPSAAINNLRLPSFGSVSSVRDLRDGLSVAYSASDRVKR